MTPASLLNIRHPLGRFTRIAEVVLCAFIFSMVLLGRPARSQPALLIVCGCLSPAVVAFVVVPARRAKQR